MNYEIKKNHKKCGPKHRAVQIVTVLSIFLIGDGTPAAGQQLNHANIMIGVAQDKLFL